MESSISPLARRALVALVLASPLAAASPVGSVSPPTWQPARIAALPSGAKGLYQGYLPTLACPTTGDCVAAGAYNDHANVPQGLVLTEVNGQWRAPRTIQPPSDAATVAATTPMGLACSSTGNCTIVGTYQLTSGDTQSFIASEVNGVWRPATRATLPSDALVKGQNAQLRAVACSANGDCSAVGTYFTNATNPVLEGFAIDEVHGSWGPAQVLTAPSNANANPFPSVSQIACAAPGDCSAIGSYIDDQNVQHAAVFTERAGQWSAGQPVRVPANASLYAHATLSALSCAPSGPCTAVGTYYDHRGATQVFATSNAHGAWSAGLPVSMPANAAANPKAFFYGFQDIACATATTCSAGGQYRARNGLYEGFIADEVRGVWRSAGELALPAGATAAGKNGGVVALSCVSAGNCRAGAAYVDGAGHYQGLVVSQVNGQWGTGAMLVLPGRAASVGVAGGVYALVCHQDNWCTATGSYLAGGSTYQGFSAVTN